MTEHIHACLKCRPDMVPDFDRADPRYHDLEKCGGGRVRLDGVEPGYTAGCFEGTDGWLLLASEGFRADQVHPCPTCSTFTPDGFVTGWENCVEPRFGHVEVVHECPAVARERERRIQERI